MTEVDNIWGVDLDDWIDLDVEEISDKYATPVDWMNIVREFRLGTNDHRIGWCD